ncbi:MAG: AMP-ligase [Xanthomonadaceae bacterium]|nr:AMP-ligase [Xanthomonadaceae bacterium]
MTGLPLSLHAPNQPVAWHNGQPVRLAVLLGRAGQLAERLPDFTHTINLCRDRHAFSVAFVATMLAGGTNLLPANRLPATISGLLREYPGSIVISDNAVGPVDCPVIEVGAIGESAPECSRIPHLPAAHLAAIVFTSGSIGAASRIYKPWHTLFESSRINTAYIPKELHFALATVPPQHMWGLETSVLMPWFAAQPTASAHPLFVADLISQLERLPTPRTLISTPVHLRALIETGLTLPETARILSATAPLDQNLAARLEATTGAQVVEVYGCSEAGCLAQRQPARESLWRFLSGFSAFSEDGHTRIDADHLPEPVRLMDRLQFEPDGRFRLLGRQSDLVNIAGKRASLTELTQLLLQMPGVVDGVIFQPPEDDQRATGRLAAMVVAPGLTASQVRCHLAARVDAAFIPRPLRLVESLPRAESGKLPRQSLLQLFRQEHEVAK